MKREGQLTEVAEPEEGKQEWNEEKSDEKEKVKNKNLYFMFAEHDVSSHFVGDQTVY